MSGAVSPPEHLTAEHDLSGFDCGVPELDDWLKRRALQNEASRASRTFVVMADGRVVGYSALATGAVAHRAATGRVRRNMPERFR
jgi:molybdopterin/thiamine biosynthesis adenylyltransferase